MSFYNRSFHFFLGQTKAKTMSFKYHETSESPHQPFESGLGRDKIVRSVTTEKMISGYGIEFAADANNGLMLCTEYLGFESYDMRMSDNEVEAEMTSHAEDETEMVESKRRKTTKNVVALDQKREFPPPLSSLNGRGHRSFYLRPVRKDGRLELTKVMVDRPEIFHASRENGRLRLHLVDNFYNPTTINCDIEETMDLEGEEEGIKEDNNNGERDHVVDLSMINYEDNDAATSLRCKSCHESSLNSDDDDVTCIHDQHDAREWRYKTCYNIVASRNHDENNHHHRHHHHHHHIHSYHHRNSNDDMHLWSRTYVKSR